MISESKKAEKIKVMCLSCGQDVGTVTFAANPAQAKRIVPTMPIEGGSRDFRVS
jgi:hypothetical protein